MKRNLSVILQLFLRSARLQKKRATLTIASLAWGTVTILLLLAFGEGLKRQMTANEQAMGEQPGDLLAGRDVEAVQGHAGGPVDPPAARGHRLRARAHAGARRDLGRADVVAHGAGVRTQDRERPRHRHALGLRRRAQALPEGARALHQSERRGGEAPGRLPRQRDGEGHLRSRGPARKDDPHQQLPVHRDRRHAAQASVLDLRRPRREPRRHPAGDVQGGARRRQGERARLPGEEGPRTWARRCST